MPRPPPRDLRGVGRARRRRQQDDERHDGEGRVAEEEIGQVGEEPPRGPGDAMTEDDVLRRLDGDVRVKRVARLLPGQHSEGRRSGGSLAVATYATERAARPTRAPGRSARRRGPDRPRERPAQGACPRTCAAPRRAARTTPRCLRPPTRRRGSPRRETARRALRVEERDDCAPRDEKRRIDGATEKPRGTSRPVLAPLSLARSGMPCREDGAEHHEERRRDRVRERTRRAGARGAW